MSSRMERYHDASSETKKRTSRNEELYRSMYTSSDYNIMEELPSSLKADEINLDKLKEILKTREEYQKEKEIRNIVKRESKVEIPVIEEKDDRTYDIRDILTKAKTERKEDDHRTRSLNDTQYNILKNIKIEQKNKELEHENEELKELIHTITSSTILKGLDDKALSLDLFDDLNEEKESSNTVEKEEEKTTFSRTNEGMDKSFFTSSLGINEKDFQEYEDQKKVVTKKRKTVFFVLFGGIIFIALIVLLFIFVFRH